jgi:protein NRD1
MRFDRVQIYTNFSNSRAVVKMRSHQDTINVREGIASFRLRGIRSIQWGLGFSAHCYMDFSTGISTIPIGQVVGIERGMLLTAKHGGTGGFPIQSGMVVEEPNTGPLALISLSPSFRVHPVILTSI